MELGIFFFETPATSANYSERIKQYFYYLYIFLRTFFHTLEKTEIIFETFPSLARFLKLFIYLFLLNFVLFYIYIYMYNKSCISIWMRLEQTFLAVRCSFDSNIIESIDWETLISGDLFSGELLRELHPTWSHPTRFEIRGICRFLCDW